LDVVEHGVEGDFQGFDVALELGEQEASLEGGEDPPVGNPELALVLAGVPDSLARSGGDLYSAIVNVAVNAWMAGHIHGEDGCTGCERNRGPAGHDWQARMRTITEIQPDIIKWFDRDVWTNAVNDVGFTVTRR
jgi:hypothetical protein